MGFFKKSRFVLDVEAIRWEQKQCKRFGVSKLGMKEIYALKNMAVRLKKTPSTAGVAREGMNWAERGLLLLDEVNGERNQDTK